MFTIERKVGRLVEAKMRSPVTLDEIDGAGRRMGEIMRSIGGAGLICADYRQARILLTPEAERLLEIYRDHNASIERSAILVSHLSAVAVLQMERVIREAKYPARRAFRDTGELEVWLGESLTAAERGRLHRILVEDEPP